MAQTTTEIRTITRTLIESLAGSIAAYHNCVQSGNAEWKAKHADHVAQLCRELLPSGSGIDSGCTIDLDACATSGDRIVIQTSFHHMAESGMYDGWTEHTVIVTPAFVGRINLRITGRDRNQIKEYLGDLFHEVLTRDVVHTYDVAADQTSYSWAK